MKLYFMTNRDKSIWESFFVLCICVILYHLHWLTAVNFPSLRLSESIEIQTYEKKQDNTAHSGSSCPISCHINSKVSAGYCELNHTHYNTHYKKVFSGEE